MIVRHDEKDATIIITAYKKRPYIKDAIVSAINQDYDRDRYEIILVKNFRDEEIENYCINNNVKIIDSNKIAFFSTILEGVNGSSSNIILLLDDDDLFMPDKVKNVVEYFSRDPHIGYIHNNYITRKRDRDIRSGYRKKYEISTENMRLLRKINITNESSISFRKEIVEKGIRECQLVELNTEFPELVFFYMSLAVGYKNLFIPDFLTVFRIHEQNTTTRNDIIPPICRNLDFYFNTLNALIKKSPHYLILYKNVFYHRKVWEYYCKMRTKSGAINPFSIIKVLINSTGTYSTKRLVQLFIYSFVYDLRWFFNFHS
ncbi:MAG: glycosyltransferase [Candidatus Parvarchaeota archaeon]